jgi:hypothetical protein
MVTFAVATEITKLRHIATRVISIIVVAVPAFDVDGDIVDIA